MTKKEQATKDKAEALEQLRAVLKPGDTVFTVVRHVAASGMSRTITPFVMRDGSPYYLTHLVHVVCGYAKDTRHGGMGLRVNGCGMDMCFKVVYNLSQAMFGTENRGGYALRDMEI